MLSPKQMKEYLDKHVAGQDEAKVVICNALFMHAARVRYLEHMSEEELDPVRIRVNNLLVTGPSGCGKTYIVERASEYLGFPVIKVNAKALSNTGFVGNSIEDYLLNNLDKYKKHPHKRHAIVIIDEFDKICMHTGRDEWQLGLQYSLLKIVEGFDGSVIRKGNNYSGEGLDTTGMLFIFAGNFEQIRKRREPPNTIGFTKNNTTNPDQAPLVSQLIEAGVVRELAGRITRVVEINQLTEAEILSILNNKVSGPMASYDELFEFLGTSPIEFSKAEKLAIAQACLKLGIGARGLASIIDEKLQEKILTLELHLPDSEGRKPNKPTYSDRLLMDSDDDALPDLVSIEIDDDKLS